MHSLSYLLIGGSSLLLLSILASKASGFLGIPSLVVFIGVGMLAGSDGPGGIYFNDPQLAQTMGMIALILILFSGGLETNWSKVRKIALGAFSLSTIGVLICTFLFGWFATFTLNFSWTEALLLAAIVSSTDAAAVFSCLEGKSVQLSQSIKSILEVESGSNDPMAAFLTIGIIQVMIGKEKTAFALLPQFFLQMVIGVLVGIVLGKLGVKIVNRLQLESDGLYPVVSTALVSLAYGVAEILGGSGFLTAYVIGIVMGNEDMHHKKNLILFHNSLAWLVQIAMFLSLGLLVFPKSLLAIAPSALLLSLFLLLVARPVSVYISLLKSKFDFREKAVISWVGLRGAVPIVLATYPILHRLPQAELIFNVVFFIVITSVLIQGTTIPYVARLLKFKPEEKED